MNHTPSYPSAQSWAQQQLLAHAAAHGDLHTVADLAGAGADLDAGCGPDGLAPLHLAALNRKPEVVRLLLQYGADPNVRNEHNQTPLHLAASLGEDESARALIKAGAHVNAAEGMSDMSPLHLAAMEGHLQVARLLIDADADLELREEFGMTPLAVAVYGGHVAVSRQLIEAGASVEPTDHMGFCPLHYAAGKGYQELAELLIEAGSSNRANSAMLRPHELALQRGYDGLAGFIAAECRF